jgi:TonB family protein
MIVLALPLTAMLAIGSAVPPAADTLQAAKELYASAAYDDALAMLTRMSPAAPSEETLQIEEYQSLCLYALGRTTDAESAVRDLIAHDPLFELKGDDVSPRVQAMFADVRKQLLPQIAKEKYAAAKAEMDAKQYAPAESHLAEVRKIIDEAGHLGVKDASLDDLGTLADGFHELVGAAIAKAAAAATSAPAATTPAPLSAPVRPSAPATYDATDTGVAAPVAIVQMIPPVPRELIFGLEDRKGLLAVTIAPDGHVEAATMRQPFKSPYDQIVLSAARTWRFKPAMKDGAPVRYVLTISLAYKPGESPSLQR